MSGQIPAIPPTTSDRDLIGTINDRLRRIELALGKAGGVSSTVTTIIRAGGGTSTLGTVNYGTHGQRLSVPGAGLTDGALWFETDRTVWYQFQAGVWRWIDGTYFCLQAALPADLGLSDPGFLASVTDYNHILFWNGSAWTAGPGWDNPCYIRGFMVDPSPFTAWKLCDGKGDDGSAIGVLHPVKYLKPDGTLGAIVSATVAPCLPDLVGSPSFLRFGATASGVNAAVAPGLTMDSYTPAGANGVPALTMNSYTPAGTNTAQALNMNSYTPAGNVSAPLFTGTSATTSGENSDRAINNGAGGTLAGAGTVLNNIPNGPHSHTVVALGSNSTPAFAGTAAFLTGSVATALFNGTAAVLTGTISTPAFTGTPAVLTGTISAVGTPQGVTLRPWMRK